LKEDEDEDEDEREVDEDEDEDEEGTGRRVLPALKEVTTLESCKDSNEEGPWFSMPSLFLTLTPCALPPILFLLDGE